MNISIIGTGYVGLVSGVCLAAKGHNVSCVDNVASKVAAINNGKAPIHEEGLGAMLAETVGDRLHATEDLASAVLSSDLTFIAVGTPFDGTRIDLSYIEAVSRQIGQALRDKSSYHVVVVKSTVIPGTTDGLVRSILEQASGKSVGQEIGLGMNPEFLTEGQAVKDFMNPDRIVIGGVDGRTQDKLADVYAMFDQTETILTNNKTAEMIKYSSNALLATMISFSNEVASLCSALGGIDVVDVMKGVHASAYLTTRRDEAGPPVVAAISSFLGAGCGFGGSCLPKDVKALAAQGVELGLPMSMLNSVIEVNLGQPGRMIDLIKDHYPDIRGLRVAVLGLAFKPDTDDVRESPAFPVIRLLANQGATIVAYDPFAIANAKRALDSIDVQFAADLEEAVRSADVVMLITAWEEFKSLPRLLDSMTKQPLVVDGRRILNKGDVKRYVGIGL